MAIGIGLIAFFSMRPNIVLAWFLTDERRTVYQSVLTSAGRDEEANELFSWKEFSLQSSVYTRWYQDTSLRSGTAKGAKITSQGEE